MNVLFDNKILNATISAENANDSYPVSNLQSDYLKQRFQSTETSDKITITFNEPIDISCLFWGWTNMTSMTVTFYDDIGEQIDKIYFSGGNVGHYYGYDSSYYGYDDYYYGYYDRTSELVYNVVSWYFPTISVSSMTVELEGDDTVFLGGIAAGEAYEMKNPEEEWDEGWKDLSIVTESDSGQVTQLYNEPLRVYNWTIPGLNRREMNEVLELYRLHGKGAHVWVDPFQKNHEFLTPLYATIDEPVKASKSGYNYSYNFDIRESK